MADGIPIAVTGWVSTVPKEVVGDGVPYTSFRMGHTPRRRDLLTGTWSDGPTEWFTVKAWRDAAFNIAASVRKGDPVLVHGRLRTDTWQAEDGRQVTTLVIEAAAVGHDLMKGTSTFARRKNVTRRPDGPEPPPGPADEPDVDPWGDAARAPAAEDDRPLDGPPATDEELVVPDGLLEAEPGVSGPRPTT